MLQKIENHFNVIHPINSNATYSSIMNYSDDLEKPFQRWYRYKEGFSIELVKNLIKEYNRYPYGTIIDPFLGSGTTLLAASEYGMKGIGFEVNPFSYFLSNCKLKNYSFQCKTEFAKIYMEIIETALYKSKEYVLPKFTIADKVFNKDIEEYYMTVKVMIDNNKYDCIETRDLLSLGWLSCLEELSNYRKAGNGLKKRKYVKPRILYKRDAYNSLKRIYDNMLEDINSNDRLFEVSIHQDSSLNMDKIIPRETISGVIFSPPYPNCFDYTEIYKLELWFGNFVRSYSDLKQLRNISLRSHLNGKLEIGNQNISTPILKMQLNQLEDKKLWDQKIPLMLQLYFNDMFKIFDNCYNVLKKDGFCSVIIGNSAYGGIVFPSDLIFAEYAESIGFEVDKIQVGRYIIPSSQQYELTKNMKNYLRESVICLRKL